MVVLMNVSLASCGGDDDNDGGGGNTWNGKVNISNVFTGKKPKALDGKIATYDSDGLLVSLTNNESPEEDDSDPRHVDITFEYGSDTRATADNNIRMNYFWDKELESYFDMKINGKGFVEYCRQTYTDEGGYYSWYFDYDDDGYLTHIKCMVNDLTEEEHIYITWEGGNIVNTRHTYNYENTNRVAAFTVSYLTDDNTVIENKGCIMLFDQTFGINMDDMEQMMWAYYAGLLGKPTKNLPCALYKSDNYSRSESRYFSWTLDSDGYPTIIDATSSDGYVEVGRFTISSFTW